MVTYDDLSVLEQDFQDALSLASDPSTPEDVLWRCYMIANDARDTAIITYWNVRCPEIVVCIASNPNASAELLSRIVEENPGMAVPVLENPAFYLMALEDPTLSGWTESALLPLKVLCETSQHYPEVHPLIDHAWRHKMFSSISVD